MAAGRCLGIDPGTVRIGLAISDPHRVLATPLATVPNRAKAPSAVEQIAAYAAEYEVTDVIVGRPIGLREQHGPSAALAQQLAEQLATRLDPVPVHLYDERFSTANAAARLRDRGLSTRQARSLIDQEAAVIILQGWLDRHRDT